MGRLSWTLAAFGIILILAASFAFIDPSLSPAAQPPVKTSGFQVILGILGLAGLLAGIAKMS